MTNPPTRAILSHRLLEAATRDPRIVGLLDYGSSSEGRADAWSDIDVALFLRDNEFEAFDATWPAWAAQFGDLLLTFVFLPGHPWAVYDAAPIPLRVDFSLHRESDLETMLTWPNAPESVEAMVWHDATGGRLTANARRIVRQRLGPSDTPATFDHACGSFWYYLLRTYCKLQRGEAWAVRYDFNFVVMGNLLALLRLESGALNRWRATDAAVGIERVISPERLSQLNACIPGADMNSLVRALTTAATLGREVSATAAARYHRAWPEALANRMITLLETK